MARTLWLHIGAEKTGTTTVQVCLADNRAELKRAGILYPQSPGLINHVALTAYALADHKVHDDTRVVCHVRRWGTLKNFRADLEKRLFAEVEASTSPTLILSNEHCSSRLRTREEVERLKLLCDKLAEKINVVLYIRNPVDFLASWYSTSITAGNTKPFPSPIPDWLLAMVNFRAIIELWGAAFGEENIIVRRFEPRRFVNGDLMDDFLAALQLSNLSLAKPNKPRNESLSLPAISFLREFNKHVPRIENGKINRIRGPIVDALRGLRSEQRFTLPQRDADHIMELFREDHHHIAKKYFGGEGDLFDPAKSVSASGSDYASLGFEETTEISALIWSYLSKRNIQLNMRSDNPGNGRP